MYLTKTNVLKYEIAKPHNLNIANASENRFYYIAKGLNLCGSFFKDIYLNIQWLESVYRKK